MSVLRLKIFLKLLLHIRAHKIRVHKMFAVAFMYST